MDKLLSTAVVNGWEVPEELLVEEFQRCLTEKNWKQLAKIGMREDLPEKEKTVFMNLSVLEAQKTIFGLLPDEQKLAYLEKNPKVGLLKYANTRREFKDTNGEGFEKLLVKVFCENPSAGGAELVEENVNKENFTQKEVFEIYLAASTKKLQIFEYHYFESMFFSLRGEFADKVIADVIAKKEPVSGCARKSWMFLAMLLTQPRKLSADEKEYFSQCLEEHTRVLDRWLGAQVNRWYNAQHARACEKNCCELAQLLAYRQRMQICEDELEELKTSLDALKLKLTVLAAINSGDPAEQSLLNSRNYLDNFEETYASYSNEDLANMLQSNYSVSLADNSLTVKKSHTVWTDEQNLETILQKIDEQGTLLAKEGAYSMFVSRPDIWTFLNNEEDFAKLLKVSTSKNTSESHYTGFNYVLAKLILTEGTDEQKSLFIQANCLEAVVCLIESAEKNIFLKVDYAQVCRELIQLEEQLEKTPLSEMANKFSFSTRGCWGHWYLLAGIAPEENFTEFPWKVVEEGGMHANRYYYRNGDKITKGAGKLVSWVLKMLYAEQGSKGIELAQQLGPNFAGTVGDMFNIIKNVEC